MSMWHGTPAAITIAARVDAHHKVCKLAVEGLASCHAEVGSRFPDEINGQTQLAAVWELCGRCIALSNAYLDLTGLGYSAEGTVLARALHEAVMLVSALSLAENEKMAAQWLNDKTFYAKDARRALKTVLDEVSENTEDEGWDRPDDMLQLSARIFGRLSKAPHNTRSGFRESVSDSPPEFAYGPHPDPVARAVATDYASLLIEHMIIVVGRTLSVALPDLDLQEKFVAPSRKYLAEVRLSDPLDRQSVEAL